MVLPGKKLDQNRSSIHYIIALRDAKHEPVWIEYKKYLNYVQYSKALPSAHTVDIETGQLRRVRD